MRSHLKIIAVQLASIATAFTCASAAVSIGNGNVQVGGFISQGYLKSSDNNYPFEAKDGTWDFREMALNVSTTVGSHLRLGAQGFAQRLGNYGDDKVILDWAVADYNFRPEIGVRVGRIKFPKGLYGEALDLDAIRPFVFLPTGIYNPILRDFTASFDGAMLYGNLSLSRAGTLDYKMFYGDISMSTDKSAVDFFINTGFFSAAGVHSVGVDHVAGISLDWATPLSGLKLHASYSEIEGIRGRGTFAAYPVPLHLRVSPSLTCFGAEYTYNDWTFAAESLRQDGGTRLEAAPVITRDSSWGFESYYISAARRFGEKWEVGTYYSHTKDLHAASGSSSAAATFKDWALSVRYNVNDNVILKIEGHSIDGRYLLFNTSRTPNSAAKDSMSYFAAKTTLMF